MINKLNAIILLLFLALTLPKLSNAQSQITGNITDATTQKPIDYATISIFKIGENNPFNGTVADATGSFILKNLPFGQYRLVIDFLGYQRKAIQNITISTNTLNVELGTISLLAIQNKLNEVTVTGITPTIQNKIDKLVYNPGNDLSTQGGVAVDILKKVPQVTVDIDGNVQLQGNPNIRFLINGKPSSIFGASLADALQAIPASQIKSIEVITSPGAKYDANGSGGIINLILKDNKVQGINGNANFSVGTRRQNGAFNLSIKKNNFGVNAFISGNKQLNTNTLNSINNLAYNKTLDTLTHLLQTGNNNLVRGSYQSGLNFSYSITQKDELTATIGFNHFSNNNEGLTTQNQTISALPTNNILSDLINLRNSSSNFNNNSVDYSLGYKKIFKTEGQQLDFNYTASNSKNEANVLQQLNYLYAKPSTGTKNYNPGKDGETNISVDYTQPFSENFIVETGAKLVSQTIANSIVTDTLASIGFIPNANQTYSFNYSRKVYAYYLSAQFTLFNNFLNAKTGLRNEYTVSTTDFKNTQIPSYNILVPSAVFSHKINATQSIKLSFNYRIQRPDYADLNPFYNISDPHNISTGNPNLKPELTNSYELGYDKTFTKGANIYLTAFYKYNTDDIQAFTTYLDTLIIDNQKYNNVFLSQRFNIGKEKNIGLSLFANVPLNKLSLRTNLQLINRENISPNVPTTSGVNYRINVNASYQFNHNLQAEIFGNYNSPIITLQGKRAQFLFYNFALRKQFYNKKASVGLIVANPFNYYVNQLNTTSGKSFTQTNLRQVPLQSFGISFSYKFGKLDFKKGKEKDDNGMPSEQ